MFLKEPKHPRDSQEAVADAENQMKALARRKQDHEDRVALLKGYIDLAEGATCTFFDAT